MNNSISKDSAVFLAIVLVAGTISTMIPASFAQSEYNYDQKKQYNGYEDSYGKDYDKKKSSEKNLQKVKCNNIIINGVDKSGQQPGGGDMLGGTTGDEYDGIGQEEGQWLGNGFEKKFNDIDKNIVNVCVNKNNKVVVEEEGTGILRITKTLDCSAPPGFDAFCDEITLDNFQIDVTGNNPDPSQFLASETPVDVTLGAGNYEVTETPIELPPIGDLIRTITTSFNGDCNQNGDDPSAQGSIAAGELQTCNILNDVSIGLP